jgi:hypothetical protein
MKALVGFLESNPDLANAVAALAGSAVALVALVVSLLSLWIQRHHNRMSLKPLPMIALRDYEDNLQVSLRNDGPGPMIVRSIIATNGDTKERAFIDLMPQLPSGMHWTAFIGPVDDPRSIAPNVTLALVDLTGDPEDERFVSARDKCRETLASVAVTVEYTDVYLSRMKPLIRRLSWFGRHTKDNQADATERAQ